MMMLPLPNATVKLNSISPRANNKYMPEFKTQDRNTSKQTFEELEFRFILYTWSQSLQQAEPLSISKHLLKLLLSVIYHILFRLASHFICAES